MAKKPKVKMQKRGSEIVLTCQPVLADTERRVRRIAATAGSGFVPVASVGRERVLGRVYADTFAASLAEARHRVLTSALDAGR